MCQAASEPKKRKELDREERQALTLIGKKFEQKKQRLLEKEEERENSSASPFDEPSVSSEEEEDPLAMLLDGNAC